MRGKHKETLAATFADPVSGTVKWRDIEALLIGLGCTMKEGSGSRIRFERDGLTLFLHRPHPSPDAKRWAVRAVRDFLTAIGEGP